MAKIPWAEIEGKKAALKLAEGDTSFAAEILKGDMEICRELRNMIAVMLEGYGPNNTRLEIKGKAKGGRRKKSHSERDLALHYAVEDKIEETGCSIQSACLHLSGIENVGEETIRKAHQRVKNDLEESNLEVREMLKDDLEARKKLNSDG